MLKQTTPTIAGITRAHKRRSQSRLADLIAQRKEDRREVYADAIKQRVCVFENHPCLKNYSCFTPETLEYMKKCSPDYRE